MLRTVVSGLLLVLVACRADRARVTSDAAPVHEPASCAKPTDEPEPRPLRRCFADRPAWDDAKVDDLLDRADALFDQSDWAGALACAEEAVRQAPDSLEAQQDRAVALRDLDRLDEARDAFTLALAQAPDDAELLDAAADLYINDLPPSDDHSAIGLEYARRGSHHVPRKDRHRRAHLALLEGQALTDLGRAAEALPRLDASLVLEDDVDARYERGVALFELCRFAEARRALDDVVARAPDHAHALYHLALIDERDGDEPSATRRFAEATRLDPDAFPPPPAVTPERFAAMVQAAVAALPDDVRADLAGVPVEAAELPLAEDLTAEDPPLSPAIVGLYRGLPLGQTDDDAGPPPAPAQASRGSARERRAAAPASDTPARAIVLYRRNLLRTVHDEAGLERAVARTLLHEVGHLRGEDDGSLRDRGLE